MPTQRDQIIDYLREHPEGADDDQLASVLNIPRRQAVNSICNRLAQEGLVSRLVSPRSGKIVNRLIGDAPPKPPVAKVTPTMTDLRVMAVGTIIELRDYDAVLQFAYAGEISLSEDDVKRAIKTALEREGWDVTVQWGKAQGIDIEGRRGTERLVLEVKGEGTLNAMRANYFVGVLGELLQRMNTAEANYGLGFPSHRQFVKLVLRLPQWVRRHLKLCVFLVRPVQDGFEVGFIPADL